MSSEGRGQKTSTAAILARKAQVYITDLHRCRSDEAWNRQKCHKIYPAIWRPWWFHWFALVRIAQLRIRPSTQPQFSTRVIEGRGFDWKKELGGDRVWYFTCSPYLTSNKLWSDRGYADRKCHSSEQANCIGRLNFRRMSSHCDLYFTYNIFLLLLI